jgi:hypothetical protein
VNNVLNEYIHQYFTKVEQLADDMRALGGTDRFVCVSYGSWHVVCPSGACTT